MDHLFRNSETSSLRKEGCDLFSSVSRVDVLAVELHDMLAMLELDFGRDVVTEIANVPPRSPL